MDGSNPQPIDQHAQGLIEAASSTTAAAAMGTNSARRNAMRRVIRRAAAANAAMSQSAYGAISGNYVWTITAAANAATMGSEEGSEGVVIGHNGSRLENFIEHASDNDEDDEISSGSSGSFPEQQQFIGQPRLRIRPTTMAGMQTGRTRALNGFRQLTFGPDGSFPGGPAPPQQGTQAGHNAVGSARASANPALRHKIVYRLHCRYCAGRVCERAMRAILLADTKIELYSTDIPPVRAILLAEDRQTQGCHCRIRDSACGQCGNVLGYHVSQPCERCLEARNNGHFWMFYAEGVEVKEREGDAGKPLYWSMLMPMIEDRKGSTSCIEEQICR